MKGRPESSCLAPWLKVKGTLAVVLAYQRFTSWVMPPVGLVPVIMLFIKWNCCCTAGVTFAELGNGVAVSSRKESRSNGRDTPPRPLAPRVAGEVPRGQG